jgi:hypothetical protein
METSSFAIGKWPWQGPLVLMLVSFKAGPLLVQMMHPAHGREDTSHEIIQYHCTHF